jgi:hypothetical protein
MFHFYLLFYQATTTFECGKGEKKWYTNNVHSCNILKLYLFIYYYYFFFGKTTIVEEEKEGKKHPVNISEFFRNGIFVFHHNGRSPVNKSTV